MAEDLPGNEQSESFPADSTSTIVGGIKYVGDTRYDAWQHYTDIVALARPIIGMGGTTPVFTNEAGGDAAYSQSTPPFSCSTTWSGRVVTFTMTPSAIGSAVRYTFGFSINTTPLATNFSGVVIQLKPFIWSGFNYSFNGGAVAGTIATSGLAANQTYFASQSASSITFSKPGCSRAMRITVSGSPGAKLSLKDTNLTTSINTSVYPLANNVRLYVGWDNATLSTAGSSLILDVSLVGGGVTNDEDWGIDSTVTIASGGPWMPLLGWVNQITSSSPRYVGSIGSRPVARPTINGKRFYQGETEVFGLGLNNSGPANTDLTKAQAQNLVAQWVARGIKLVRLHHIDGTNGLCTTTPSSSINSTKLDNFHYLIHCLSASGLLYTLDGNSFRGNTHPFGGAEASAIIPGASTIQAFKTLVWLNDAAYANWLAYNTVLLGTVNPYTGYSIAQDPALLYFYPVNEEIPSNESAPGSTEEGDWIEALLLAETGVGTFTMQNATVRAWIASKVSDRLDQMATDLAEIGYTGPFTAAANFCWTAATSGEFVNLRSGLAIESRHEYINIPTEATPKVLAGDPITALMGPLDTFFTDETYFVSEDHPQIVQELNSPYPSPRSSMIPFAAGAAALREWAFLILFDWADSVTGASTVQTAIRQYQIATDPLRQMAMIPAWALAGRRDLRPLAQQTVETEPGWEGYTEIALNRRLWAGRIITPGCVVLAGFAGASTPAGNHSLQILSGAYTTLFITAIDKPQIEAASTIILGHLTDLVSEGATFTSSQRYAYTTGGSGMKLVHRGAALFSVAVRDPNGAVVYRINADGTRGDVVPHAVVDGKLQVLIDNLDAEGNPSIGYEVDVPEAPTIPTTPPAPATNLTAIRGRQKRRKY